MGAEPGYCGAVAVPTRVGQSCGGSALPAACGARCHRLYPDEEAEQRPALLPRIPYLGVVRLLHLLQQHPEWLQVEGDVLGLLQACAGEKLRVGDGGASPEGERQLPAPWPGDLPALTSLSRLWSAGR